MCKWYPTIFEKPSCLIGYTGFVGSNLRDQLYFDEYINRSNLDHIRGRLFHHLFRSNAGSMWHANNHPEEDNTALQLYVNELKTVKADRFVLLSTINVYGLAKSDEILDEECEPCPTTVYGTNRLKLERFVQSHFPMHQIVRLPGLFGPHLKKNVLYDLTHNHRIEHIQLHYAFQWYNIERLALDLKTYRDHSVFNITVPLIYTRDLVKWSVWDPGRCQNTQFANMPHIQSKVGYLQSKHQIEQGIKAYLQKYKVLFVPKTIYLINTPRHPTNGSHYLFMSKCLKGFAQARCQTLEIQSEEALQQIPDTSQSVLLCSNIFSIQRTREQCEPYYDQIRSLFDHAVVFGWGWNPIKPMKSNWILLNYNPTPIRDWWPHTAQVLGGTEFEQREVQPISKQTINMMLYWIWIQGTLENTYQNCFYHNSEQTAHF